MDVEATRRRHLDRLATALRRFGLVDDFGLGEVVNGRAVPESGEVARRLRRMADRLPRSITPEYLGDYIVDELRRSDDVPIAQQYPGADARVLGAIGAAPLSEADIAAFSKISPGRKTATHYHRHIVRVLTKVLDHRVANPRMELSRFNRRGRVDLTYDNVVKDGGGFFADLVQRHGIHAPYIYVECKNYSEDPSNPEFAQLSHRLNREAGRFGMLVCRSVGDRETIVDRARDLLRKSEYVIVLDDSDVIHLARARVAGDEGAIDQYLNYQLDQLRLH